MGGENDENGEAHDGAAEDPKKIQISTAASSALSSVATVFHGTLNSPSGKLKA